MGEPSSTVRLITGLIRDLKIESEVMSLISKPSHKQRWEMSKNPLLANSTTGILNTRMPVDPIKQGSKQAT